MSFWDIAVGVDVQFRWEPQTGGAVVQVHNYGRRGHGDCDPFVTVKTRTGLRLLPMSCVCPTREWLMRQPGYVDIPQK